MNHPVPSFVAQALDGGAIDLLHPKPAEVDFRAIAEVLSRINRYTAATPKPVSVALHTLIVVEATPDEFKPWALLHDAHEARLGDITTPVAEALDALAGELGRDQPGDLIAILKARHDAAIFRAAGLPAPNDAARAAIARADLGALSTERRDFLSPPRFRWHPAVEATAPARKVWRLRAPDLVADALHALFVTWLPVFRTGADKENAR